MSLQKLNICPVCGAELSNGVCGNCGYIRLIFPEVVPESIKTIESQRVNSAKTILRKMVEWKKQSETQRLTSEKKIADLNRELADYLNAKKRLSKEKDALEKEVNSQKSQISSLKRELDDERTNNHTSLRKTQSRITDMENQVNRKNAEIKSILSELEGVKRQLNQSALTPDYKLHGIVMIEDKRNDTRTMLPVYEGNNSYGTNPDNGLHHQIRFQIRGFSFLPVQFYIRTSSKGLILEPASGVEMTQNGGIVRSGVYARQSDNFMFGDRIRINITQI